MKSLSTALLVGTTLLASQSAMSIGSSYNTYSAVGPGIAGKSTNKMHPFFANGTSIGIATNDIFTVTITTAGNYDFSTRGIDHPGVPTAAAPSVRRNFYTAVTAGKVLDATGAVVATMTPTALPLGTGIGGFSTPSGFGTQLDAKGTFLLPGVYTVNITTNCNTLCAYFENGFTASVSSSDLSLTPAATTTSSLPDAIAGVAYSASVAIPFPNYLFYPYPIPAYQIVAKALPPGLSYAVSTDAIGNGILTLTGVPTASGNANVTFEVTDPTVVYYTAGTLYPLGYTLLATTTLPLTIKAQPVTFAPALPNGTVGVAYSTTVTATGGSGSFSYSAANFPAGLSLAGNTISGTPTIAGAANVSLTAIDTAGLSSTQSVMLSINAQPIAFTPALPNGTVGAAYSTTLAATGGTGALTYTAANLPAGLALSGNTISGTPTTAGVTTVSLTATDVAGVSSVQSVILTINAAPTNYTVSDSGKSSIKTVGAGYLMVGTKKLIWDAATKIIVNTTTGVVNTIDNSVKAGMKISWSGLLDKKTNTVLTKSITIN